MPFLLRQQVILDFRAQKITLCGVMLNLLNCSLARSPNYGLEEKADLTEFKKLISHYFSITSSLGLLKNVEMTLDLTDDKPIASKSSPTPCKLESKFKDEMSE